MKAAFLIVSAILLIRHAEGFCCVKPGAPPSCASIDCPFYETLGPGADLIGRCNQVSGGNCCQYSLTPCDIAISCADPTGETCDLGPCDSDPDGPTNCKPVVPTFVQLEPRCQRVRNIIQTPPPPGLASTDECTVGPAEIDYGSCCGNCCDTKGFSYDPIDGKVTGFSAALIFSNSNTHFFNTDGVAATVEGIRFRPRCGRNVLGVMIRGVEGTRAGFWGQFTHPGLNTGENWRCLALDSPNLIPANWMDWNFDDSSWIYDVVPAVSALPGPSKWIWGANDNLLNQDTISLCRIRYTYRSNCDPSKFGTQAVTYQCADGTNGSYDVSVIKGCDCRGSITVNYPPEKCCPDTKNFKKCVSSTCGYEGKQCEFDAATKSCECPV